jgi:hypothetical protein
VVEDSLRFDSSVFEIDKNYNLQFATEDWVKDSFDNTAVVGLLWLSFDEFLVNSQPTVLNCELKLLGDLVDHAFVVFFRCLGLLVVFSA